jgi:hypothetical protein
MSPKRASKTKKGVIGDTFDVLDADDRAAAATAMRLLDDLAASPDADLERLLEIGRILRRGPPDESQQKEGDNRLSRRAWLRAMGFLDHVITRDKRTRWAIGWLAEHEAELKPWWAALDAPSKLRMGHPVTVRNRFLEHRAALDQLAETKEAKIRRWWDGLTALEQNELFRERDETSIDIEPDDDDEPEPLEKIPFEAMLAHNPQTMANEYAEVRAREDEKREQRAWRKQERERQRQQEQEQEREREQHIAAVADGNGKMNWKKWHKLRAVAEHPDSNPTEATMARRAAKLMVEQAGVSEEDAPPPPSQYTSKELSQQGMREFFGAMMVSTGLNQLRQALVGLDEVFCPVVKRPITEPTGKMNKSDYDRGMKLVEEVEQAAKHLKECLMDQAFGGNVEGWSPPPQQDQPAADESHEGQAGGTNGPHDFPEMPEFLDRR